MREWLLKVNGTNPQARKVCGFQPVYEADVAIMTKLLEESQNADYFEMLYSSTEVEVYMMCILRRNSYIRFHDIRFIASLIGYEEWLISAGLIAVNTDRQLKSQVKQAKKALAKAMYDIWGVDVRIVKSPGA